MSDGTRRPTGEYPQHWLDYWHKEGGENDRRGAQPQVGVTLLRKEMDGLAFKVGYEVAWDDVTNQRRISSRASQASPASRNGIFT